MGPQAARNERQITHPHHSIAARLLPAITYVIAAWWTQGMPRWREPARCCRSAHPGLGWPWCLPLVAFATFAIFSIFGLTGFIISPSHRLAYWPTNRRTESRPYCRYNAPVIISVRSEGTRNGDRSARAQG
jgi:hypothetical protein